MSIWQGLENFKKGNHFISNRILQMLIFSLVNRKGWIIVANDIIVLDDITLDVKELKRDEEEGTVYIEFDVASEDYHNLSEHLYKEEFLVRLPGNNNEEFQARIINYSTSLDNLYEEDQVGEYRITLKEEK